MAKKFHPKVTGKANTDGNFGFYVEYKNDEGSRRSRKGHDGWCKCRIKRCEHLIAAEQVLADYLDRLKAKSPAHQWEFESARTEYESSVETSDRSSTTLDTAKLTLRTFGNFMKANDLRLLSEIDFQLLLDWRKALRQGGKGNTLSEKPATTGGCNAHFRKLSAFFGYCTKSGKLAENPICGNRGDLFYTDIPRINWLTHKEIEKIHRNTTGLNHDIFVFLLNTGCRSGELRNLRWQDVHENNVIFRKRQNWRTKNKKDRDVPLNDDAKSAVERRRKAHPETEYVFPNEAGNQFDVAGLNHHIERIFERLKIVGALPGEPISPHSIRDTFATVLINEKGVPLATVSELLGHSTITQTMKYVHTSAEHKTQAIDKLSFAF